MTSFNIIYNNIRFPEDCVYSSDAYWKVIKIGNGPLGFGECYPYLMCSKLIDYSQMNVVLLLKYQRH